MQLVLVRNVSVEECPWLKHEMELGDLAAGRCEDTDEVVGSGDLHVEQMDKNCFWARLSTADGKDVVMWFNSKSPITLTAEFD